MNASVKSKTTATEPATHSKIESLLVDAWYKKSGWLWLLFPFSIIFYCLTFFRRVWLSRSRKKNHFSVPVVVVGNISVGGTGKTPLIISLCEALKAKGYRPGVISRGYGSSAPYYPFAVTAKSVVEESGDEPLLIAQATGCPVVIDRNRCAAAEKMIERGDVDVILSDDGLQHYQLPRDIEIIVTDATRGFGNQLVLPAGPLREPMSRLSQSDFIIATCNATNNDQKESYSSVSNHFDTQRNFFEMRIVPDHWCRLTSTEKKVSLNSELFSERDIHAVAGIGNPQRFFSTLDELDLNYQQHVFPDHHRYIANDFQRFDENDTLVMTEKDAVKIRQLSPVLTSAQLDHCWYLSISAQLNDEFYQRFFEKLRNVIEKQ